MFGTQQLWPLKHEWLSAHAQDVCNSRGEFRSSKLYFLGQCTETVSAVDYSSTGPLRI